MGQLKANTPGFRNCYLDADTPPDVAPGKQKTFVDFTRREGRLPG